MQEGHTSLAIRLVVYVLLKSWKKKMTLKKNEVIENRVVILGLGEPKQIIR